MHGIDRTEDIIVLLGQQQALLAFERDIRGICRQRALINARQRYRADDQLLAWKSAAEDEIEDRLGVDLVLILLER